MKKFSNVTVMRAQHPQAVARFVLAFVASLLVMLLGLIGASSGAGGAVVFAQATESPAPETGPAIKLLNPSPAYDPNLTAPPRPPGSGDPPKLSDKFDGFDRQYHVVAVTRDAPANAVVEAYFQPTGLNEITVGTLNQVSGSSDTWEFFWDIPDALSGGGTFKVRLFQATPGGFEEVASDETPAEIDQGEETAEISFPTNNGPLGFFKPKVGLFRTVVEGSASGDSQRVFVFYSTSAPGSPVKYTNCAQVRLGALNSETNTRPFAATCGLSGKDLPSQVTAIAAVAIEDDSPEFVTTAAFTQDSADAHRVQPYLQRVEQMTVELRGVDVGGTAIQPTSQRRQAVPPRAATSPNAPNGCLRFDAIVRDQLGRPVQGANLDVHIQGPDDQVGFGSDQNSNTSSSDSNYKDPDGASHEKESARNCPDFIDVPGDDRGDPAEAQGDHNVPGGPDIKHIESLAGTGLDTASPSGTPFRFGPGIFRFFVFSRSPGFTEITAWVDDEPIATETDVRAPEDDILESGEVLGSLRAQWLPAPASLSIVPRATSSAVGECTKFIARARAGTAVLPNVNVDVHASGPNNDLDFCELDTSTPRRAPDQGEHDPEDAGESSHKSSSPDVPQLQHTEGETDGEGNFVFGLIATASGTTQVTAWIDGEKNQDNDVQGSSEPAGNASNKSAATAQDAEVRFVNPSGYGGGSGDTISRRRDADERFHIVSRVDLPDVVPGVEYFIGSSSSGPFTKIGDASRVGDSDAFEFFWDVNVPDGSYTLRAQITGTDKREDRAVVVNNTRETAEITRPLDSAVAPFDKGETTVEGVASAAARGVEFYYTKTAARESRSSANWIRCGSVTLSGGGATQNFAGKCSLQDPDGDGTKDFPAEVTGIAALSFICESSGCQTIEGREVGRIRQSGDAHRVFGFEANPVVSLEPAETAGKTAECKRFELSVNDGSGLGIADVNVDVHLTGPTDTDPEFCDLEDGSPRRFPDRGEHSASFNQFDEGIHQEDGIDSHHTEGETNDGGKFVFGVTSSSSGDSQILAWVDQDDNDVFDANERSDNSIVHWGGGSGTRCTITGNAKNNVLNGTSGDDVICGRGGDDRIRGRGGNDTIIGASGNDLLRGNRGRDLLRGGRGSDRLDGGSGRDTCRAGAGRDSKIRCER